MSMMLTNIRSTGGTLPVSRGQISGQGVAALSRMTGNEFAVFRSRETGQRFIRELGPTGGDIPANSRLTLHSQPGMTATAVMPSSFDRFALQVFGQWSSVIINAAGTFSMRFGRTSAADNSIRPLR